jgi:hypothetical protein
MSVTLTNAEKQARYRERHLGVDGEKVRSVRMPGKEDDHQSETFRSDPGGSTPSQ